MRRGSYLGFDSGRRVEWIVIIFTFFVNFTPYSFLLQSLSVKSLIWLAYENELRRSGMSCSYCRRNYTVITLFLGLGLNSGKLSWKSPGYGILHPLENNFLDPRGT